VGAEIVREAEPHLIEAAPKLDIRRFAYLARRLRECVDPEGALGDANRDHERRRLHLSQTLGGCWRLDGWLDPEGGGLLKTALLPLMKPVPDDRRTGSQRCADAFVELCHRQLDGGRLPLVHGQRPHLFVTVPLATLRGEPGSPGGEIRLAGPVVGEVARRLACDAVRTEITIGAEGELLAVGEPEHTIHPKVRRKVVARDQCCRFPGCTRPLEWCDVHHIDPTGPSELWNLLLLCRPDHTQVHEGGWRIVRVSETGIEFVPPGARSP
jgi:Domain of unknown function (DUF222)